MSSVQLSSISFISLGFFSVTLSVSVSQLDICACETRAEYSS